MIKKGNIFDRFAKLLGHLSFNVHFLGSKQGFTKHILRATEQRLGIVEALFIRRNCEKGKK